MHTCICGRRLRVIVCSSMLLFQMMRLGVPIETSSTPPVNRLANGARTEPCRNVRSQLRPRQHWFRFRSCSLSEWQNGDTGGTEHGNSGGTKNGTTHGTKAEEMDGRDRMGTLGGRDGGKREDGKSEETYGWTRRSSWMRCLF